MIFLLLFVALSSMSAQTPADHRELYNDLARKEFLMDSLSSVRANKYISIVELRTAIKEDDEFLKKLDSLIASDELKVLYSGKDKRLKPLPWWGWGLIIIFLSVLVATIGKCITEGGCITRVESKKTKNVL